ncbi:MarR family transcriptional regulator [Kribbella sp. NBC_00382]|uniref:MarR family transcriptional regulator n=1 Tax=Kribbella sp. NBC_00382 TaxID=2975967 RepID=UPI002E207842
MNGVELFLLGRALMKIGEQALPSPPADAKTTGGSTRTVLVVATDIRDHPDSAIGEIATRTGLPQSQVSTAVARLKEAGSIETAPDPADRRRSLVRPAGDISPRVKDVRTTTIDTALLAATGTTDLAVLKTLTEALNTLAHHLQPSNQPG